MRYVSPRDKQNWFARANETVNSIHQNVLPLSMKIIRDLLPTTARFLPGTDSGGGYAFMVPVMHYLRNCTSCIKRLTSMQTLLSATVELPKAMRAEREFGTIEVGKRADLVLLSRDPRGIWIVSLRRSKLFPCGGPSESP